MSTDPREQALSELARWKGEVDGKVSKLSALHGQRITCHRGCSACCVDGISVQQVEAEQIRRAHPELLAQGEPRAEGACAFLDAEGACRIYAVRPYVCRTYGVPQRWVQEHQDGDFFEYRDICEKNEAGGAPVTELPQDECWTMGLIEEKLRALQAMYAHARLERVNLRDLFQRRA